MVVTGPETVVIAYLRSPARTPDGRAYYMIETTERQYFAGRAPMLRDAAGQPMVLDEELWAGSEVKIALDGGGLMVAIQVLKAVAFNPFCATAVVDTPPRRGTGSA